MSSSDEKKVLSLEFDGKQFEKGISGAMESLENLDDTLAALGNSGGSEVLDDLSVSAENLGRVLDKGDEKKGGWIKGLVDMFKDLTKFHLVNDAAKQVSNFIETVTSSVNVVSNAAAGWGKYAEKTQAMQTITSATGKTVAEVEPTIQKLLDYVDETSYSFTDMVNSIGKFTAQGIELEQAELAMEGISNWAALSGQGINEANRAMYNLAQALALGSVRLQDWHSIEGANMATKEFKETVIELAKAEGLLSKEGKTAKGTLVTYENFSQTLAEGWFSSDLLIKVLSKYADKEDELGNRAFKAAQQATTFQQAIDAVKDSATTGWLQTWELMFGNLDEAIDLWTGFATALQEVVGFFAEARNSVLRGWNLLGGRNDIIEGIVAVWETLIDIADEVVAAFNEIFNPFDEIVEKVDYYVDDLAYAAGVVSSTLHIVEGSDHNIFGAFSLKNITEGIKEFGQNVKKWFGETIEIGGKTTKRIWLIGDIARNVFQILAQIGKVLGGAFNFALKIGEILLPVVDAIFAILGDPAIGEAFDGLFEGGEDLAWVFDILSDAAKFLADALMFVWDAIKKVFGFLDRTLKTGSIFPESFSLGAWDSIVSAITNAWDWVKKTGATAWNAIQDFLFGKETPGSLLAQAQGKGKQRSGGIIGAISNWWDNLSAEGGAWSNIQKWFEEASTWVGDTAGKAWNAILDFLLGKETTTGSGENATTTRSGGIIGSIVDWWNNLSSEGGAWTKIQEWFETAKKWVQSTGGKAWNAVRNFLFGSQNRESIYGGDSLEAEEQADKGIIGAITTWWGSIGGVGGIWTSICNWFEKAKSWIVDTGTVAWDAIHGFLFGEKNEDGTSKSEDDGLIGRIRAWWSGLDSEGGVWSKIKEWFETAKTWVTGKGKDAWNAIKGFLFGTPAKESIYGGDSAAEENEGSIGIIDRIRAWWSGLGGVSNIWGNISKWFTDTAGWVTDKGAEAWTSIKGFLFGGEDEEPGAKTPGIVDRIKQWWTDIGGVSGVWTSISDWFSKAVTWIADTGSNAWSTISEFLFGKDVEGENGETTNDGGIVKKISDWWNGTGDARGAWESIREWAQGVFEWLSDKSGNVFDMILDWLIPKAGAESPADTSGTDAATGGIMMVLGDMAESVVQVVTGANDVNEAAQEGAADAEQTVDVMKILNDAFDSVKRVVSDFFTSVGDWLVENADKMEAAKNSIIALSDIFLHILQGMAILKLIKGVGGVISEVGTGVKNVSQTMVGTVGSWAKGTEKTQVVIEKEESKADAILKIIGGIAIAIVVVVGAIWAIAEAMHRYGNKRFERVLTDFAIIAGIIVAMGTIFTLLGMINTKNDPGKTLLEMSIGIAILVAIVYLFAKIPENEFATMITRALDLIGFIFILVMINSLGALVSGGKSSGTSAIKDIAIGVILLIIPIMILYAMLRKWGKEGDKGKEKLDDLFEAVGYVIVLVGALTVIDALGTRLGGDGKMKGLFSIGLAVMLLMLAITMMRGMVKEDPNSTMVAMSYVLMSVVALVGAVVLMSKAAEGGQLSKSIAVIFVLGLLALEFAIIVDYIKAIDPMLVIGFFGGLAVALWTMGGLVMILGKMPVKELAIGVLIVAVLAGLIGGIVWLTSVIAEASIGNINSAMDALSEMITKAAEIPFDKLNIPASANTSIHRLMDILSSIMSESLFTTITTGLERFLGGSGDASTAIKSTMDNLVEVGTGIAAFAESVSGVSAEKFHTATIAADLARTLQGIEAALMENGQNRFEKWFEGDRSLLAFTNDLGKVGENLATFSDAAAKSDPDAGKDFAKSLKYIAEAASIVQNVDIGSAKTKLNALVNDLIPSLNAAALTDFSAKVAGDYTGINNFSSSLKYLLETMDMINSFNSYGNEVTVFSLLRSLVESLTSEDFTNIIDGFSTLNFEMETSGFTAGQYYVEGLKNGLESPDKKTEVETAATTLGKSVDTSVRTALGISSPSSLGIVTGEFYGEGLAMGIDNGEDTVGTATSSLVETITGPFSQISEFFSNFSLFGKDENGNPLGIDSLFSGMFGEGFSFESLLGLEEGQTIFDKIGLGGDGVNFMQQLGFGEGEDFLSKLGIPEDGLMGMLGFGEGEDFISKLGLPEGKDFGDILGIPEGGLMAMLGLPAGGIGELFQLPEGGFASLFQLPEGGFASLFEGLNMPAGGIAGLFNLPEGGLSSFFSLGNNPDGSPKTLSDIFDFSGITDQMTSIFSGSENGDGGIMGTINNFVTEASSSITDGLTLSPVITPVLDMSNVTGNKIFSGAFTKDGKLKTPVLAGSTGGPVAAADLAGKVLYSRNETSSDRDLLSSIVDNTSRTASSLTNKNDNGIIRAINNLPASIAVALEGLTVNIDGDKVGDATSGRVGGNLSDDRGRILGGFGRPRY